MPVKITKKRGSVRASLFRVNIGSIGKTLADITEAYFVVKANESDADGAALILKTTANGIVYIQDPDDADKIKATVPWVNADYSGLTNGTEYFAGFFFKFTGDAVADEDVEQDFILVVEEDLLDA